MDQPGCYRMRTKKRYVRHAECATDRAATHLPAGIEGVRTYLDIPLAGVCRSALSSEQWRLVLHDVFSRSLKNSWSWTREVEDQTSLGCELLIPINCRHDSQVGAQEMVHQMEIGGREFSGGRLVGCRCSFTQSTLTALALQTWKLKM